jgi:DNA processing protein
MSETISSAGIEHLRWSLVPGIGPILFGRLIERFGSAQAAMGAGATMLEQVEGIGRSTAGEVARERDRTDVSAEVELAERHGVRILCREDDEFPMPLRHIPDPPICLYLMGRLDRADALSIAIVGSRRCTHYGREQSYRFGERLARCGMTVVSGLARGVDSQAHRGALVAGGRTIAVLGNGLASIYPPEHADLAREIAGHGAVISELPMSTSPDKGNFLPRNRVIAGLSLGVLVIEAARRSGSLTTARLATEYDREIFALPGRVDSEFSSGTNAMIRDSHAKLVTCPEDIIDELGEVGGALKKDEGAAESGSPDEQEARRNALVPRLSHEERRVYDTLNSEELSIEEIADAAELPAAKAASTLISLQLKGLARQLPGNLFVRASRA